MQRSMPRELLTIFCVIAILILIVFKMDDSCSLKIWDDKPAQATDSTSTNPQQGSAEFMRGRELFKSNCASCHNPLVQNTGPALKGAVARWEAAGTYKNKPGKEWLHIWVKNYNDAVTQGYPYAIAMVNSSGSNMNPFPQLKDEDIDNIFLYVEEYKK